MRDLILKLQGFCQQYQIYMKYKWNLLKVIPSLVNRNIHILVKLSSKNDNLLLRYYKVPTTTEIKLII